MNTTILASLTLVLSIVGAFAQGSLIPPGAPAMTMKSLDQVEARTPIPGGSAPYTISTPGSYYLTGNLTVTGGDAITITAAGSNLDLNGFTVSSTANPAAGIGVKIAARRVTVYNGTVSGAGTTSGTTFSGAGFQNGVLNFGSIPQSVTVRDVSVAGCSLIGIKATLVERCMVQNVGTTGIQGSIVRDCQAESGGQAINAYTSASDCSGTGFTGGITGGNLSNCTGILNGDSGTGLAAGNAQNCGGTSLGTGGTGLTAVTATNCQGTSYGSGPGLFATNAQNCVGTAAVGSTGVGLKAINATNCQGTSDSGTGLAAGNAQNCGGTSLGTGGTGLTAVTATNCQGTSYGSGSGLNAITAQGCTGTSDSGYGLNVKTGMDCYGQTSTGAYGLYGLVLSGSRGKAIGGSGTGLEADTATNCSGDSYGGTYGLFGNGGITNCYGFVRNGPGTALFCFGTATGCTGTASAPGNPAIAAVIAIGCTSQGGTINATSRYNMP